MARRYFIVIAAALLAGCLAFWVVKSAAPGEPVYHGKKLTQWLDGHMPSSAANPPYGSPGWNEAHNALQQIGAKAIPVLLKEIQATDWPARVIKLIEWAQNRRVPFVKYRYASWRREQARYMFQILNTNAAAAVPGLVRIYKNADSTDIKRCVASALSSIGHQAQPALPLLLKDCLSTNDVVRFNAVSALLGVGGDPDAVLPAMILALKDPDVNIRWNASVVLSEYEGRARVAVPVLLDELQDPGQIGNSPIRHQIETALWRIAPEKVGLPLVIEEQSLAEKDGKTVAPVAFEYNGKRRIVIAAGKSVPCVQQFWNRAPRDEFSVYRGTNSTATAEVFLGRFQVMGVPDLSTNPSVSLLCVVAGGQIVLCARDNLNEKFLEIRRLK